MLNRPCPEKFRVPKCLCPEKAVPKRPVPKRPVAKRPGPSIKMGSIPADRLNETRLIAFTVIELSCIRAHCNTNDQTSDDQRKTGTYTCLTCMCRRFFSCSSFFRSPLLRRYEFQCLDTFTLDNMSSKTRAHGGLPNGRRDILPQHGTTF